jgi:hypothetical protein
MTKSKAVEWARSHHACYEAVQWLESLQKNATMADAWKRCKRSDWMLWALEEAGQSERYESVLRLFAVSCARRALLAERKAGREPDKRCWEALRVAKLHANGNANSEDLAAASAAAWDAARGSARGSARAAASAAAWDAARDAVSAAAWGSASAAAWGSAWDAARGSARGLQAKSLRRLIPEWPG